MLTIIKLFAPFLPFITETIYQGIFTSQEPAQSGEFNSIHLSAWPIVNPKLEDDFAEQVGAILVEIAIAVRRYKSENSLSLGTELQRLELSTNNAKISAQLANARGDLLSITRAAQIDISNNSSQESTTVLDRGGTKVALTA